MIRAFDIAYFMVSVDTPEDNKAFAEKEHADFPILSDPDKTVANAYGVIPPDRPPDGSSRRAGRSTSIRKGKIAAIDKEVQAGRPPAKPSWQSSTELGVPKKKHLRR